MVDNGAGHFIEISLRQIGYFRPARIKTLHDLDCNGNYSEKFGPPSRHILREVAIKKAARRPPGRRYGYEV
jgi:hypothetical protein